MLQFKLVFSDRFKDVLNEMKPNFIASELLDREKSLLFDYDISYIDITTNSNVLSYTSESDIVEGVDPWKSKRSYLMIDEFLKIIYYKSITKMMITKFKKDYDKALSNIKKPSTSDELIKKLLDETKSKKLIWNFANESVLIYRYEAIKNITKEKNLLFQLYVPKSDSNIKNPFLYIRYVMGKENIKLIDSITNNNILFDLSYVVRIQSMYSESLKKLVFENEKI